MPIFTSQFIHYLAGLILGFVIGVEQGTTDILLWTFTITIILLLVAKYVEGLEKARILRERPLTLPIQPATLLK